MEIKPIQTTQSSSDRFAQGADISMMRVRFMAHAVIDLVGVFIITALLVWALAATITLGPPRAQVCAMALLAKLVSLPALLGLPLPCWLPTGVTWVAISTLREQSLPLTFYGAGVLGAGMGVIVAKRARQWFLRVGAEAAGPEFLRGAQVGTAQELNAMIPDPGPIKIGVRLLKGAHEQHKTPQEDHEESEDHVQLPKGAHEQGILIIGASGTGKTQLGLQLLAQLMEEINES